MKKRVDLEIKVRVSGDTAEDAINAAIRLVKGVDRKVKDPKVVDEYHYWDKENEGDVDWVLHKDTTVYGTATGRSMVEIVNR